MRLARTPDSDGVPGLDPARVARWLAGLPISAEPPLEFALAGRGKSNITAIVTARDGRRWVLRRPPLGNLLPTAHDVSREYRIISSLQGTGVPVPAPIALTTDTEITDAPMMLMQHVEGLVIDEMPPAEAMSPEFRGATGRGLVEALAAVHAVDLTNTGLHDLASHRPFAPRQLKRWRAQWEASKTRHDDRVDALASRLTAAMPEREELVLVHGDYHLRNAIFDKTTGRVRALIDWELSTLGDPLADLGLLLAYWSEPDDPPGQPFPASALPGFPRREELVGLYAAVTGRDTSHVGFWEVLGLWKVAVILEGVHRRALNDPRNALRGATVERSAFNALVERAWARADAIGI
jgi:aminoglycoside phosphotransferase (APT) family kinase protein